MTTPRNTAPPARSGWPGGGEQQDVRATSLAENGRVDHQPVLVDEVVLHQRLDQRVGAVDEDLAVESGHVVDRDDVRVVPRRIAQRRRHDVLRHRVELVGEARLVGAIRPRGGEALVGRAAEQERVGGHHLVDLELVALVAALELERPAAELELLGAPGVLHHAVEGDELRHHDLPHDSSLSWSTDSTLPAGSVNQAMYGPPARMIPRSSCSIPS
jgi:hypothetical protein